MAGAGGNGERGAETSVRRARGLPGAVVPGEPGLFVGGGCEAEGPSSQPCRRAEEQSDPLLLRLALHKALVWNALAAGGGVQAVVPLLTNCDNFFPLCATLKRNFLKKCISSSISSR